MWLCEVTTLICNTTLFVCFVPVTNTTHHTNTVEAAVDGLVPAPYTIGVSKYMSSFEIKLNNSTTEKLIKIPFV